MDQVFERAEDVHVRNTYVYKKDNDVYAYADAAYTTKIKAVDLKNLFVKGAIVVVGTALYAPIAFAITTGVGALTYAIADAVPTAAKLEVLYSEEHVVVG